ncbi:MAG TPA: autotransporter-associated beta strand repeat-containing protein, partial [Gemmataceae bacterium]|nr:autotransporter-associated beta strand repeat-containing protein [Gemmataceae bacterium]
MLAKRWRWLGLRSLTRSSRGRPRQRKRLPPARPLQCEALEDRLTPAQVTWAGAVSANWADAGNWSGGHAPANGDDLVFPAGAQHLANNNNLLTSAHSITFQGDFSSGNFYSLGGGALALGGGGLLDTGTSGAAQPGGNAVGLNLTLASAQTWTKTNAGYTDVVSGTVGLGAVALTYGGRGALDVSGAVSGGGKVIVNADVGNLFEGADQSAGTLELSHTNSYTGGTTITGGRLLADADGALGPGGAADGGTTVAADGQLELADVDYATPERVTLNGGTLLGVNDSATTTTFAGALTVTAATAQGNGSAAEFGGDVTSRGNGAVVLTGAVNFSSDDLSIDAGSTGGLTFTSALTGSATGGLVVGLQVEIEQNATVSLNHADSYAGVTHVFGGASADGSSDVLRLGAAGALPDTALDMTPGQAANGATLDLNGFNLTVTELVEPSGPFFHSNGTVQLRAGTLTFGSDNRDTVFGGVIA